MGGITCLKLVFVFNLWMVSEAMMAPKIKLNNGLDMPVLALGTYPGFIGKGAVIKTDRSLFRETVAKAIQDGYRHFDTAAIYETEAAVGEGIKQMIEKGVVSREDIFVTTKLWNTQHGREQVVPAMKESLRQLGLTYVDLYLIHFPVGLNADYSFADVDYLDTWRGMEELIRLGLAKSIGVSNFNQTQLKRLLDECNVRPTTLQIEVNPDIVQTELVSYAQSEGLAVMGYSPFGTLVNRFGSPDEPNPLFEKLAKKYSKTQTQIALRWLLDRNIVPLPKTTNAARLKENMDIFDFNLTEDEIQLINSKDRKKRYTLPSFWQDHPYYPFEKVDNPVPSPF